MLKNKTNIFFFPFKFLRTKNFVFVISKHIIFKQMIEIGLCIKKKISILKVKNRKNFYSLCLFFTNIFFFYPRFVEFHNFFFFFTNSIKFFQKICKENRFLLPSQEFFFFFMFFSKKKKSNDPIFEKKSNEHKFFLDFKNYKEIFYPDALKSYSRSNELKLSFVPFWINRSFSFLKNLNYIQARIFPVAFGSDLNLLVCSPTGTGKTTIAGFCILRIIINSINKKNLIWKLQEKFVKILYIVPMKTLVKEIGRSFFIHFKNYGFEIFEITSDITVNFNNMLNSNIVVGIPEKIELLSKNSKFSNFFSRIRLLIVDEIHILNEERGAILEKFLMRFLMEKEKKGVKKKLRIVGLSATYPNFFDAGKFLSVNFQKGIFYFDPSFRRIPLHQTLIGVKKSSLTCEKKNLINKIMQKKIKEIFNRNNQSNIIVFVQSRKDTLKTAWHILSKFEKSNKKKYEYEKNIQNSSLYFNKLIEKKIGIHHAGLSKYKKEMIEQMFKEGKINILVSTATLAWGVNLPASHVIIKGTRIYDPKLSSWDEISSLNIIQMLGRAGRFSSIENSEGIIITSYRNLIHYSSLLHHQKPIESRIIKSLPDLFSSECAINRITNISNALNWLSKTYFFIRLYRFITNQNNGLLKISLYDLENHLKRIFVSQIIKELKAAGMLFFDSKKGVFSSTSTGLIASNFSVNHQTILLFLSKIKPCLNYCELIHILSLSYEFSNLKLRINEKTELERIENLIFFPIKRGSTDSSYRTNILIQSFIGNIRIFNTTLATDSIYVGKTSSRLFRAFFEIVLIRRWSSLVNKSFEIFQAVHTQTWPNQLPFRKLLTNPSDDKFIKILEKKKINLEALKKFSKKEIEIILHSKRGSSLIHKILSFIPFFRTILNIQPITRNTLKISLSIKIDFDWKSDFFGKKIGFWVFLEDEICDTLIFYNYFFFEKKKKEILLNFYVPIFDNPISPYYFFRIKCDHKIRCNLEIPIDLTCIEYPYNHPINTKMLTGFRSSFNRIFSGFFGGKILTEYFETHHLKTFGFFYQIISYIFKNPDHKILSFVQNKTRFILKEISFFSFFIKGKTSIFMYISSGFESLKLNKLQLQKCSIGILGISIEKMEKGDKKKITKAKDFSFYISSSIEFATLKFKLKNFEICNLIIIIDALELVGNLNFNFGLEYLCETFIFDKISGSRMYFICSVFPILNLFELLTWLDLKAHHVFSCHSELEKIYYKKIKFNSTPTLFLNSYWSEKMFIENKIKSTIFIDQIIKSKNSFLFFLSNFFLFITFSLPKRSFFFHKIFLNTVKKKNILKIFFGLKAGFLVDSCEFCKRRLIEEGFVSNFLKFFFVNATVMGIVNSEKLSCEKSLFFVNSFHFKKNSVSFYFHLPLIQRCKRINFLSKVRLISTKNLLCLQPTIESMGVRYIKEKVIRYITEKATQSINLIQKKLLSTFYSTRLVQNPQFYGFTRKFDISNFVKKITNLLIRKYQYNLVIKQNFNSKLEPTVITFILCFYFFPEHISNDLLSALKKKISSFKITKTIINWDEFLFFKTVFQKNYLTKNKFYFTKSLFQKMRKLSSKASKFKYQIIFLRFSLERFFQGWLNLFKSKTNLNSAIYLLELNQTTISNFIKKFPELIQINIFTNISSFLMGKIHNIYSFKSFEANFENFCVLKKFEKKQFFLKKWLEKLNFVTRLKVKIFIKKVKFKKNLCFFLNIKKAFPKKKIVASILYQTIDFSSFTSFWWLLIGNINSNSVYLITKIFIKNNSKIKIKIFFNENIKKFKVVFINNNFPFLDKEAKINLLFFNSEKHSNQKKNSIVF